MLDFSKLNMGTPEERAAERQEQHAAFIATMQALITDRTAKIEALETQTLSESDTRFVRSLKYLATTYDIEGIRGEKLATLSGKQLSWLDDLHRKHCSNPVAQIPPRPRVDDDASSLDM